MEQYKYSLKVPTGEEEEQEIFKIRAKLFRFDTIAEPPEWWVFFTISSSHLHNLEIYVATQEISSVGSYR